MKGGKYVKLLTCRSRLPVQYGGFGPARKQAKGGGGETARRSRREQQKCFCFPRSFASQQSARKSPYYAGYRSGQNFVYEISRGIFYQNLQRFVWRRHAGAHPGGKQHVGRKPTETSVTECSQKSVNLSLEVLINFKVIFYNTCTVKIARFPEKSHFFNLHNSSLNRNVNASSRKRLTIRAYSITKPRTLSKRKFVSK